MTTKLREPLGNIVECGLPAALEVMGERWSFMILRAALNGVQHFEEFQCELGIARNILSNRLQRLVTHGILKRDVMPQDRRKILYALTEKGADLLVPMVALRQWGEKWESGMPSTPVLVDERDLQPIRPVALLAHDGRVLAKHDLRWMHTHEVRSIGSRDGQDARDAGAGTATGASNGTGNGTGAAPAMSLSILDDSAVAGGASAPMPCRQALAPAPSPESGQSCAQSTPAAPNAGAANPDGGVHPLAVAGRA
ncbi:MAG: winged helix-turn-helix transcriptional regulator [Sphingopyxis sp.]